MLRVHNNSASVFNPSTDAPCRVDTEPLTSRRSTSATTPDDFGLLDYLIVCVESKKFLFLGPFVAGLIALGVASILPETYVSVAYLGPFNEGAARSVEALMRSPSVIDVVLNRNPLPIEDKNVARKVLEGKLQWAPAPGAQRTVGSLYTLGISDNAATRAQAVNTAFIDAWFEASKPGAELRAKLEARLERTQVQLKSVSILINRLEKETPTLVLPGVQSELASPLASLLEAREKQLLAIEELKSALAGPSRDLIVAPPSLPTVRAWPRRLSIVAFSMLATGGAILVFVLLRDALSRMNARPDTAHKMARLRAALWRW